MGDGQRVTPDQMKGEGEAATAAKAGGVGGERRTAAVEETEPTEERR